METQQAAAQIGIALLQVCATLRALHNAKIQQQANIALGSLCLPSRMKPECTYAHRKRNMQRYPLATHPKNTTAELNAAAWFTVKSSNTVNKGM